MLAVGEMYKNMDQSSTFQVAGRLMKADKMFDLLFVPGGSHGAGGHDGQRKLEDFFVHNILAMEPPDWNTGTDAKDHEEFDQSGCKESGLCCPTAICNAGSQSSSAGVYCLWGLHFC